MPHRHRTPKYIFEDALTEFLRVFPDADSRPEMRRYPDALRFLARMEDLRLAGRALSSDERKDLLYWAKEPASLDNFARLYTSDKILVTALTRASREVKFLCYLLHLGSPPTSHNHRTPPGQKHSSGDSFDTAAGTP